MIPASSRSFAAAKTVEVQLICPQCDGINRAAEEHLVSEPVCDRCKSELMAARGWRARRCVEGAGH